MQFSTVGAHFVDLPLILKRFQLLVATCSTLTAVGPFQFPAPYSETLPQYPMPQCEVFQMFAENVFLRSILVHLAR